MTSTDIAAWWGAIVASLVLFWDVYKWKTQGPRIVVRLSPNMKVMGDQRREGKTWVMVTATNTGDRPTTIKGIGLEYYESWLKRLRQRPSKAAVFPNPSDHFPLPRLLNPGDEWVGLVPQHREDKGMDLEEMSKTGHLVIWLSQSHKLRAMRKRLTIQVRKSDS